jgi:Mce-associated membrane protein
MAVDAAAAGKLTAPAEESNDKGGGDDMDVAHDSDPALDDDIGDVEDSAPESDVDEANALSTQPSKKPTSAQRRAMLVGLAVVVALAALVGWWGFRAQQSHQAQAQRSQFVQTARQGALNLTTIDWQRADADVQRILGSATGEFYDDFAKRSQPFIELVKQAKSTSVGTVSEAGLESQTADTAQVLVAVSVTTSYAGAPQPNPHAWRMRISVQRVGDQVKVSNVEFVP